MQHYLSYYARKFGKDQITLSLEASERVSAYSWPGNIRKIRNVSEQLAVLCEWDIITAAEILGISKTTLWRKCKELRID